MSISLTFLKFHLPSLCISSNFRKSLTHWCFSLPINQAEGGLVSNTKLEMLILNRPLRLNCILIRYLILVI